MIPLSQSQGGPAPEEDTLCREEDTREQEPLSLALLPHFDLHSGGLFLLWSRTLGRRKRVPFVLDYHKSFL